MPPSAIYRSWNLKTPITALSVNRNGDVVAAALGDGSLRLLPAHAEAENPVAMKLHDGISLSLQPDADGHAFLSSGDDGKIFIIDPNLSAPTLLAEHKNHWIDHVAASVDGARAYSIGKNLYRLNDEGKIQGQPLPHPSSIGGLAFSPNGKRLAASHYNGASLWWTNSNDATPEKLEWKGSHLGLIWHPDGKTLLTSLQEGALHGWRLSDSKEMQMQGYVAKIHSLSFTAKGRYLATSGGEQAVCWPFFGGGPWGKTPVMLGGAVGGLVARVAAHPKDELIAIGYDNGAVFLAPLDGRMEMMIHAPVADKGAAVTGLVWNGTGDCLFVALDHGYLLLFTIHSVKQAVAHA